jgi:MinD-like ATPase involved in chromosome partitioning or flagellar assembly
MATPNMPDDNVSDKTVLLPHDETVLIPRDETVLIPRDETTLLSDHNSRPQTPWWLSDDMEEEPAPRPAQSGREPASRPDPRTLVRRVPSGEPAWRVVWRNVARMLSSSKSARELVELTSQTQAALSTGRRVAITSVRGGAGKSALAAVLASVYASRRAEPVLAADADPDSGSLLWRLGVDQQPPLSTLATRLCTSGGSELHTVEQVLPRTETGLWVLPGGTAEQPHLVRDVTRALSRLFAVCVTDCGLITAPATTEVVAEAHAVVVIAPATPDGVHHTYRALAETSSRTGFPLSRVVVVLNVLSKHGAGALRTSDAREAFRRLGTSVVVVPYDRHVASGAPVTLSRISEATLLEMTRLAAQTLARADPL